MQYIEVDKVGSDRKNEEKGDKSGKKKKITQQSLIKRSRILRKI